MQASQTPKRSRLNIGGWSGTTWLCVGCAFLVVVGGIASIPRGEKRANSTPADATDSALVPATANQVWRLAQTEASKPSSPCYRDPWCVVNNWEDKTVEGMVNGENRLKAIRHLRQTAATPENPAFKTQKPGDPNA